MANFEKKSIIEKLLMEQKELEAYYRELRYYQYINGNNVKSVEIRKRINKLVVSLLKIKRKLAKQELTIVSDERQMSDKPKIYACSHIGRYDIEMSIEAINDASFLLMGDPGEVYRSVDGLFLNANGVIFTDTDFKEDRHIAKETCIKTLQEGGNVLMFPEGAWNITENEVIMKLYTGVIEMAKRGNAEIIPVAIEQYETSNSGKHYFVNIGRNIDGSKIDLANKREEADDLRGVISGLRWDIWESQGITKRKDLDENYSKIYLDSIMAESENGYTVEEINRTRYIDKNITTPEEVYKFQNVLVPSKNNAFLLKSLERYNKRLR